MNAVLVLVFMLNGQPKEVQIPVDLDYCLSGAGAQIEVAKYLHDHPAYTYDPHSGWKCRIGAGKDDPAPMEEPS